VNVNIQFKKGVLELCVLVLIGRKDRYGYELAQASPSCRRGSISTATPSCVRGILHHLFTGIDRGTSPQILSADRHGQQLYENTFTGMERICPSCRKPTVRKEVPMNRKQFLTEVERRLFPLPAEIRNELLGDLSQHFDYGLVNGKSGLLQQAYASSSGGRNGSVRCPMRSTSDAGIKSY
jgi:hypothetical protein